MEAAEDSAGWLVQHEDILRLVRKAIHDPHTIHDNQLLGKIIVKVFEVAVELNLAMVASNNRHNPTLEKLNIDCLLKGVTAGRLERLKTFQSINNLPIQIPPITLFPAKFPRPKIDQAVSLGIPFNDLIDAITVRPDWICEALEEVCMDDEFTMKLVNLCRMVYIDGTKALLPRNIKSDIRAHINRSDYMLHQAGDSVELKQIEINTIASSFGCLSDCVFKLHSRVARELGFDTPVANVNQNVTQGLAELFVQSEDLFLQRNNITTCSRMLQIIYDAETNIFDQLSLVDELESMGRSMMRISVSCLVDAMKKQKLKLTQNVFPRILKLSINEHEEPYVISIVYFRALYDPSHYFSPDVWDLRKLLELSDAIKIPSLPAQLAGTKKIQAVFASQGNYIFKNLFPSHQDHQKKIQDVCMRQVSAHQDTELRAEAIIHPDRFVLKPQREGGGHNLFDSYISTCLQNSDRLAQYILMERIYPPSSPRVFLSPAISNEQNVTYDITVCEAVSELGVYSCRVSAPGIEAKNKVTGFLLRTKPKDASEGGVNAGYAALDSFF